MATLAARSTLEKRERVSLCSPLCQPSLSKLSLHLLPHLSPTLNALSLLLLLLIIIREIGGGVVVIGGRRSQTAILRRQKTAEWHFVS